MIANFWLRPGNASASHNFISFLEDTLSTLQGKKVGLLRMDSGFFIKQIFDYLEHESLNFIIAVKNYHPIQRELASCRTWVTVANGIEIAEFEYHTTDWDCPRRMVAVRQKIKERPNATSKQLSLFEEDKIIGQYRFSVFITNIDLPAKVAWDTYRLRADSEDRTKELKEDFAMASFTTQPFLHP